MSNDTHFYEPCVNLQSWTRNGFSFTGVKLEYSVKMEQVKYRAVIRYLYLKGHTPQETFDEMKTTHGEDTPSYDVVKPWHRQFKYCQTCGSGFHSWATPVYHCWEQSIKWRLPFWKIAVSLFTVRDLGQDVDISVGVCGKKIIPDHLHMHKLSARWILRLLTPHQNQERVNFSKALLAMCQ